jgi:hypothetical protein
VLATLRELQLAQAGTGYPGSAVCLQLTCTAASACRLLLLLERLGTTAADMLLGLGVAGTVRAVATSSCQQRGAAAGLMKTQNMLVTSFAPLRVCTNRIAWLCTQQSYGRLVFVTSEVPARMGWLVRCLHQESQREGT